MDASLISSLGYGLISATITGLMMPTCSTGRITLATYSPRDVLLHRQKSMINEKFQVIEAGDQNLLKISTSVCLL